MTSQHFPALAKAFPEFDQSTLPAIPADWVDMSWRGERFADACPHFGATPSALMGTGVMVVINWEDRCGCGDSYIVTLYDCEYGVVEDFGSEDWQEILARVTIYRLKWESLLAAHLAATRVPPIPKAGKPQTVFARLCVEFQAWSIAHGMIEGDAMDLLYRDDLTKAEKTWLIDFNSRWDAMADECSRIRGILAKPDTSPERRAALELRALKLGH